MKSNEEKRRQFRQSLASQVNNIENEAKMILQGIQTLFGFQLIVGFNSGFKQSFTPLEQNLHLVALLLVAISGILIAAPAAYHRQANHQISAHFVALSGKLISLALWPLALGTCLDIYLVSRILSESRMVAVIVATVIATLYAAVWFIYPQIEARRIRKLPAQDYSDLK